MLRLLSVILILVPKETTSPIAVSEIARQQNPSESPCSSDSESDSSMDPKVAATAVSGGVPLEGFGDVPLGTNVVEQGVGVPVLASPLPGRRRPNQRCLPPWPHHRRKRRKMRSLKESLQSLVIRETRFHQYRLFHLLSCVLCGWTRT